MEAFIINKGYKIVFNPLKGFNDEKVVDETYKKEYAAYLKDRAVKSLKVSALIRLAVDDGPLIQIKGLKDAMLIWNKLQELYEPKGFSSEFLICKELFSTTLSRCGNSIENYL